MRHQKLRSLVLAALFAAVTAVMAQLVIPLGFTPIPFTLAIVAVMLTGGLLDYKTAFLAQACYLLVGAVGIPVFSYFGAGLSKLAGPTGGYLLGYPLMAMVTAWLLEKWGRGFWKSCIAMVAGLAVCYTVGTMQLMLLTGCGLWEGLWMAVIPFAPFDVAKALLASVLAAALHRALRQAHLLAGAL